MTSGWNVIRAGQRRRMPYKKKEKSPLPGSRRKKMPDPDKQRDCPEA
jgi:hypothetical protein